MCVCVCGGSGVCVCVCGGGVLCVCVVGVWGVCVCVAGVVCVCVRVRQWCGVCVPSHVQLFVAPHTVSRQALCPWNFPGKNSGVGLHFLLQGIFLILRLNPRLLGLLKGQASSLPPMPLGKPQNGIEYDINHCIP